MSHCLSSNRHTHTLLAFDMYQMYEFLFRLNAVLFARLVLVVNEFVKMLNARQ